MLLIYAEYFLFYGLIKNVFAEGKQYQNFWRGITDRIPSVQMN